MTTPAGEQDEPCYSCAVMFLLRRGCLIRRLSTVDGGA